MVINKHLWSVCFVLCRCHKWFCVSCIFFNEKGDYSLSIISRDMIGGIKIAMGCNIIPGVGQSSGFGLLAKTSSSKFWVLRVFATSHMRCRVSVRIQILSRPSCLAWLRPARMARPAKAVLGANERCTGHGSFLECWKWFDQIQEHQIVNKLCSGHFPSYSFGKWTCIFRYSFSCKQCTKLVRLLYYA